MKTSPSLTLKTDITTRGFSDAVKILGGAAQDSNVAQLKFEQVKDSYPPVFEAKGTDDKIYSFEMTSISIRLSTKSASYL